MKNIKEIIVVGEYEDENQTKVPVARVLSNTQDFRFSVLDVSAWAVCLFNAVENHVPEEEKGKFSTQFKHCFDKMFEERSRYTKIVKS